MISFFVHGKAVPKGSSRAMQGPPRGKPCSKCKRQDRGFPYVINANDKTKLWEKSLRGAARVTMMKDEKIEGAVRAELVFFMERPKNHHVAGDRSRPIKEKFADVIFHTSKPDVDKLARTVLDGLTGICFGDDATVFQMPAIKYYGPVPGVLLTLTKGVVSIDVRRRYEEDLLRSGCGRDLVQETRKNLHQPELFEDRSEDTEGGGSGSS